MSRRKKSFKERVVAAIAWADEFEQQVVAIDYKHQRITRLLKGGGPEYGESNRFYFQIDDGRGAVYHPSIDDNIVGEYTGPSNL